MPDLPLTISEAAEWLRGRRMTSVTLTEAFLARSRGAQDTVGAFITFTEDSALKAARQADADFANGVDRGPLQGVPIAVKDLLATRDAPTTANSRVLDPSWGDRDDATVVKKLREAGAVILGKLGLHEFALGWPDPDTGFRIPKNPWNLAHSPGGSSSGTGAAIAAGLILGGLGSDTGGSIRGPASYCGISGIKQTYGLVSKEGCVPLGYSLDHVGPMARSVQDCAHMLQVLAGFDRADPCSVHVPVPDMTAQLNAGVRGIRIGVPRDYFFTVPELNDEIKSSVLAAIDVLAGAGATVLDVEVPHAEEARHAQRVTMMAEAYAYHEPDLKARPDLYGKYTRRQFQIGALLTSADFIQAQRVRSIVRSECLALLGGAGDGQVDVLITPTMPGLAQAFDGHDPDGMLKGPSFMGIWNLTGFPAMSIPCGFSKSGLPIGMQIIAGPFAEPTVFRVGQAYQVITDWHLRTPTIAGEEVAA